MKYVIFFIIDFIIVYSLYYFFFIRKARRGTKAPSEAQFVINLYELDIKKFSYRRFLINTGIVSSIDVALVALIVLNIEGIVWELLFSIIVVIPVAIVSFMVLGKYYQHKQEQDNTKELEQEKKYLEKKDNKKEKKSKNKKEEIKEIKEEKVEKKKTSVKTKKKGQKKNDK